MTAKDTWTPGSTRRPVEVICCPACGSVKARKTHAPAASLVVYWQCTACGERWKEARGAGGERAAVD